MANVHKEDARGGLHVLLACLLGALLPACNNQAEADDAAQPGPQGVHAADACTGQDQDLARCAAEAENFPSTRPARTVRPRGGLESTRESP